MDNINNIVFSIQNTIDFINQNILLDFKQKFQHNTQV